MYLSFLYKCVWQQQQQQQKERERENHQQQQQQLYKIKTAANSRTYSRLLVFTGVVCKRVGNSKNKKSPKKKKKNGNEERKNERNVATMRTETVKQYQWIWKENEGQATNFRDTHRFC